MQQLELDLESPQDKAIRAAYKAGYNQGYKDQVSWQRHELDARLREYLATQGRK